MWLFWNLSNVYTGWEEKQLQNLSVSPWNAKTVTWALPELLRGMRGTRMEAVLGPFSSTRRDRAQVSSVTSAQNWSGIFPWCPCSLNRGAFVRKRERRESKRGRDGKTEKREDGQSNCQGIGKEDQLREARGRRDESICRDNGGLSWLFQVFLSSWEMPYSLKTNLIFMYLGLIIWLIYLFPSV